MVFPGHLPLVPKPSLPFPSSPSTLPWRRATTMPSPHLPHSSSDSDKGSQGRPWWPPRLPRSQARQQRPRSSSSAAAARVARWKRLGGVRGVKECVTRGRRQPWQPPELVFYYCSSEGALVLDSPRRHLQDRYMSHQG